MRVATLPLLFACVLRQPMAVRLRTCAPAIAAPSMLRTLRGLRSRARRPRMLSADGAPMPSPTVLPDYAGLLGEAERRTSRLSKKQLQAESRAADCEARQAELLAQVDASLEALEALPPCTTLRERAAAAAAAHAEMVEFAEALRAYPAWTAGLPLSAAAPEAAALASRAAQLAVRDHAPDRPLVAPKKKKGPRPNTAPRKPYRVWRSGGAEIRVGRTAADNDVLSTDPAHRDDADWWLHVSGCPGSHVVVRAETLQSAARLPDEIAMDAAVLAVNNSRATLSGRLGVSLCRAKQVSKPPGAKPGLVRLSGDVTTLKVDWRKERHRLDRLGSPEA
jgi:hypothetical protein